MPVKSPGSATITRLTFVPPSLEAQTDWLDWVKEVALSPDGLDVGPDACADANAQLPSRNTVKIHTVAGMSSLQTCRSQVVCSGLPAIYSGY